MIKRVSIFTALLAVAAMAQVPAAQAKPAFGLADQALGTLQDSRFQESGIRKFRIAVSYDQVRKGGRLLRNQDAFFRLAREQRLDVLVSFYRTSSLSPKRAAAQLPTVAQFRKDFRAFRKRYPQIKRFSTWNEINFNLAQPTGRNPKRAGQYYKMLRQECRGGKCSVLTGDFRPDGTKRSAQWLKTFQKEIGGGTHQWGLIPYLDVNRFTTRLTKQFLKDTKRGNVQVTEVGGLNVFDPFKRTPLGGFRKNLSRQNRAVRYTMVNYPRVSSRIKTIYVYNWRQPANQPSTVFDSALIDASGEPRPAYNTFTSLLKSAKK